MPTLLTFGNLSASWPSASLLVRPVQINASYNAKIQFWFWFLTEETLLSRRAPIKEALPSPNVLPVLILTPQTCQLTNQL